MRFYAQPQAGSGTKPPVLREQRLAFRRRNAALRSVSFRNAASAFSPARGAALRRRLGADRETLRFLAQTQADSARAKIGFPAQERRIALCKFPKLSLQRIFTGSGANGAEPVEGRITEFQKRRVCIFTDAALRRRLSADRDKLCLSAAAHRLRGETAGSARAKIGFPAQKRRAALCEFPKLSLQRIFTGSGANGAEPVEGRIAEFPKRRICIFTGTGRDLAATLGRRSG